MLKIQSDRVIIDGHEPTKEQCETMTLLANALTESNNFKTVEYRDGYAEFEKVGKADELKFWNTAHIIGTLNGETFNISGVSTELESLTISASISATGLQVTFSGNVGGRLNISGNNAENYFVPWDNTIEYSAGDTANFKFKSGVQLLSTPGALDDGFVITLSASSKLSIDLTTLPGWSSLSTGSHNITIVAKADGYRDSEPSAGVFVTIPFVPPTDCIVFTGETSDFTLRANQEWDGTVEYCTDVTLWTPWDGTEILSHNKKLYLRGSGNTTFYAGSGAQFALSDRAGCSGNLNTLLDHSNPPTELSTNNCYRSMFDGCTNLTTAPELPATTLAEYCYENMFRGCTNLTTAPALPATSLIGYCYYHMFSGCASLKTAPALPATTLAEYCYTSMFEECTNLTQAPALPATTLAERCYSSMFYNCTSLIQAPDLPATTLANACYRDMFDNCTNLTTAPELPATTLASYCYEQMFQSCTGLTTAPELPATTLEYGCYASMFNGCTNLTTAPALPATSLIGYCYRYMFMGCTAFKVSSTKIGTYQYAWRIPTSGTISSTPSGWNTNMLADTGGTFTSDPSINTTYYVENAPV